MVIFNLITRSPELFDIKELKDMSECDYIVKFWSRLVELVFTKTGMSPHWGDTVSEVCKKNNRRLKMDLRILCKVINDSDTMDDLSAAEFSKHASNAKLYEDRTKLVIHAKMILNQIIASSGAYMSSITDLRVCMLQVMGLQAEILSLRLIANGLYVLESHGYLYIPTTLNSYAENMNNLVHKLSMFKELSMGTKYASDEARRSIEANKNEMSRLTTEKTTPTTRVHWTRKIWNIPDFDNNKE
ncbi:unnamed protein product [Rhizopus stolonifer]